MTRNSHPQRAPFRASASPWCILALILFATTVHADDRLSVLFIAVDDMNCSLGCYGNTDVSSPHIDALAQRGVLFERAYCQQAVCNPSRASVMTGLRPDTVKVWDLRADFRDAAPDAVTLPQLFKQNDYHTQNIGKIFHNTGDLNDEPSWSVPSVMHEGRHSDDYQLPGNRLGERAGKGPYFERGDLPDEAYLDGRIANAAIDVLKRFRGGGNPVSSGNRASEQSLFLAVGFWRPHLPFLAPEPYWERYDAASLTLPAGWTPPKNVPEIALHDSRELFGYLGVDRDNVDDLRRRLWHGYYAGISYVDAQIGRVVQALDESGLANRTVIVLWSDHGFHLGQHDLWCKTSCFELDARVPLIIVPPNSQHAGSRTRAIVELLDLYPTLVELCGLEPPASLEGRSLVPLLEDPEVEWPHAALTQHPRPAYYKDQPEAMGYSLRTDRYRYTEWRDWRSGEIVARELYDHETDPDETINVADSRNRSAAVTGLHRRLGEAVSDSSH
jgi:iduronate 2-sulfatase